MKPSTRWRRLLRSGGTRTIEDKYISRPIPLGHDFPVHPRHFHRLLLPQGFDAPIAATVLSVVLQAIYKRARQDSNLRPAD
jgi:hypothetical protein